MKPHASQSQVVSNTREARRAAADAAHILDGEGARLGGVPIRGLGRYMELKQMAREQAEALRQREQKAFILEPAARTHPYTVPEPFKMHGGEGGAERVARTMREVEQVCNAVEAQQV